MFYSLQKKLIVPGVLLGSFFLLPFLTYADTASNLVVNPGLETASSTDATFPEHWSQGFWGANNAVFTYPTIGADGTKAAKVEITNYTSGDAKWFFTNVPVRPGEQYMFSGNYMATVPADVVARYTLIGGDYKYAYLGTSVTSLLWTGYATLPFTVPEGAVSLTVFHLIHEAGSLSIDNVSLRQLVAMPELLSAALKTPNTPIVAGGAVPLWYISHIVGTLSAPIAPSIPQASTKVITQPVTPSTLKTPAIVAKVLKKINNMGTLTYTRHPEETKTTNDSGITSFIHPAEAAAITPSNFSPKTNGVAPLGTLIGDFSNLTLAASGLLLILFSLGVTFLLTASENRKRERRTELWDM